MSSLLDPRDPDPGVQRRLRAWLALQTLFGLRPARARAALARHADPAAALASAGRPAPSAAELDAQVAALGACDGVVVPWDAPVYPEPLRRLVDPPAALCVRGDPAALSAPAVALVGARAATAVGRSVARALAGDLARAGLAVVSGLARGIDGCAHEGALEAGGRTLAVLGCGLDVAYPREHAGLARRIADRGAVVSELVPGTQPLPLHFPLRNRLISGLSRAVVVVEAREGSGSLITAEHAHDQGVEVLAVPGPVNAPTSRGSNLLLRDGAAPVLDADDVLRALGLPPAAARAAPASDRALPAVWRALLDALPATPDELSRALAMSPARLAVPLLELELAGRVRRERDGRLVAV